MKINHVRLCDCGNLLIDKQINEFYRFRLRSTRQVDIKFRF